MRPISDVSYPSDDYEAYLDWLAEQPCAHCYEDNRHCCCQELDERFGELDEAFQASLTDPRRI